MSRWLCWAQPETSRAHLGPSGGYFKPAHLASAVLKRYDDEGRNEADLRWCTGAYKMRCIRLNRRWMITAKLPEPRGCRAAECGDLPAGRHYLAPSDKLDHKVAKILKCRTPPVPALVAVST